MTPHFSPFRTDANPFSKSQRQLYFLTALQNSGVSFTIGSLCKASLIIFSLLMVKYATPLPIARIAITATNIHFPIRLGRFDDSSTWSSCSTGQPHLGHDFALSEIIAPHSVHCISAISELIYLIINHLLLPNAQSL